MFKGAEVTKTNQVLKPSDLVNKTLKEFLQIANQNEVIICGGVAIQHHLDNAGLPIKQKVGQDEVDLLAVDLKTLQSILKKSGKFFYISHYHDYSKKKADYVHADSFYGVLIDKETNVKIDIFDVWPFYPQKLIEVSFNGKPLLLRSPEDQAVTQMLESYRILGTSCHENAISPRQFAETYWLNSISNPIILQRLWSMHPLMNSKSNLYPFRYPGTYEEAYLNVASFMLNHPEVVYKTPKKDGNQKESRCPECVDDKEIKVNVPSQPAK